MTNLGDKAEHQITGFQGIVTGRAEYLSGCEKILIQPQGLQEKGNPIEAQWFDVPECKTLEAGAFTPERYIDAPGGPQHEAPKP